MSDCLVSAKDFKTHFRGMAAIEPPVYGGEERRVGERDRRDNKHDRRWDVQVFTRNGIRDAGGRRLGTPDRRKGK